MLCLTWGVRLRPTIENCPQKPWPTGRGLRASRGRPAVIPTQEYGTPDFTEEGDEELAALYRVAVLAEDGLYHDGETP